MVRKSCALAGREIDIAAEFPDEYCLGFPAEPFLRHPVAAGDAQRGADKIQSAVLFLGGNYRKLLLDTPAIGWGPRLNLRPGGPPLRVAGLADTPL